MDDILSLDNIKKYSWHLKVMGAYVQQPTPAIVGLDLQTIIASNDAAALYPTSIIYSNIGFDTIRHRVYDTHIIRNILRLIEGTFKDKENNPAIIDSALNGFTTAIGTITKEYFKNKSVQNKKEAYEFTITYYPMLLKKILTYHGKLDDIFNPKDDQTYVLLKSCLYPILEAITWLNPNNNGYNQLLVNYVFFNEDFIKSPQDIYILEEINSTKSRFKKYSFADGISIFENYIVNPYGVLFDKHKNNLAYDVKLLMDALANRRIVKNQMLVLYSITNHWAKLSQESLSFFDGLDNSNDYKLTSEQANQILTEIRDDQDRKSRIDTLMEIEWYHKNTGITALKFGKLRSVQFKIIQEGIKVAANSAYGIFGLITWPFASPLIGNAITNAGKIYGIKLFQAVTVDVLGKIENTRDD